MVIETDIRKERMALSIDNEDEREDFQSHEDAFDADFDQEESNEQILEMTEKEYHSIRDLKDRSMKNKYLIQGHDREYTAIDNSDGQNERRTFPNRAAAHEWLRESRKRRRLQKIELPRSPMEALVRQMEGRDECGQGKAVQSWMKLQKSL